MRLQEELCLKSRFFDLMNRAQIIIIIIKNTQISIYNVRVPRYFFFSFLFFFLQFRLKLKNPTSVSNEISTKRVLPSREQFFWRTVEQDSLSLSLFHLFFFLPSFIPILVYLPSVTDWVRCQAELKSFHRVQMVLIFMLLPLLVSREISVQFILMRVLKSDWTDGERFALTKLCRLLNGDSYF